MKFGLIACPELVDYSLPVDHVETGEILSLNDHAKPLRIFVGCAKWNRNELKNFYPRGTKDELVYYSRQFNSIEMNTTFYRMPDPAQVIVWKEKTPDSFRFFPKVSQQISHIKRLKDAQSLVEEFCGSISCFEEKLGMVFLQLHNNFGYKNFDRLKCFVELFPKSIPLAVELRNTQWFNDPEIAAQISQLFHEHGVTNIITDTAGRRDLLHMRLTTPVAFIRYVGANLPKKDRNRLDSWVGRIGKWINLGLRDLYFFVHQNEELESPLLADYFIRKLNKELGLKLRRPKSLTTKDAKDKTTKDPK
jgi:uncharacterized protein YecE (DUF72 family)